MKSIFIPFTELGDYSETKTGLEENTPEVQRPSVIKNKSNKIYFYRYIIETFKISETIELIKDLISSSTPVNADKIEKKIYETISDSETILIYIATDEVQLPNVCAMAARLFFAKAELYDLEKIEERDYLIRLIQKKSHFIRLGVVLGLADAKKWDFLKKHFLNDECLEIREEVEELLNDERD